MSLGNSILVDYGIQTEESDLRAHVCVVVGRVYVYPTKLAVAMLESSEYKTVPVYSAINGTSLQTATGYIVPWQSIPRVQPLNVPKVIKYYAIEESDNTTIKGKKAVDVVSRLLQIGWFPLPADPKIIQRTDLQYAGLDIIVALNVRIQVKCDFKGGHKELGGTGNLFLQTQECNPLQAH